MAEWLDDLAHDVLCRRDEDLPDGAKDLIMRIQLAKLVVNAEPRKSYHFLGDWKEREAE